MGEIDKVGGTGVMFVCDLSDPDGGRAALVERSEAALGGPIDILVNVAAMGPYNRASHHEAHFRAGLDAVLRDLPR